MSDRADVVEEMSALLEELAASRGNVSGDEYSGGLVSPDVGKRLLLKAYALVYPADYRNFQFRLDPTSGLLEVTAVGRTARRLLEHDRRRRGISDRDEYGDDCRYGSPREHGRGLGKCPITHGLARDEVAPGAKCCQHLSADDQKRIQRNVVKASEALINYINRDPTLARWAEQQHDDPFLDDLISIISQWTLLRQ
jgi:hypothetical protein